MLRRPVLGLLVGATASACLFDPEDAAGLACLSQADCGPELVCVEELCVPSCPYTADAVCDEPEGTNLCFDGTDTIDCPPYCRSRDDGRCDEPQAGGDCPAGTDIADCATFCHFEADGQCDEPEGTDVCPEDSDVVDCAPYRPCDACLADEIPLTLDGLPGCYCAPLCDGDGSYCPDSSTTSAVGQCVVTLGESEVPGACGLICQLSEKNCPAGATCQDVMVGDLGICTFPSP